MVSHRRVQNIGTDSKAATEDPTLEPGSTIEDNPGNTDNFHPQLLERTQQTLEDTNPPPPPYEETESRRNMPRDSSSRSWSRRDSHSSETRHLTVGNARRRDINENSASSSSRVVPPTPPVRRAILVLGTTGAGKSSFIAAASGLQVPIGHNLGPGTVETRSWSYTTSGGSAIALIDTPGLNDQNRPDTEILTSIVDYIRQRRLEIIAVVYLHRITERKLTGSAKLNLRVLQALCGDHFLRNLILVTSMWEAIPRQEREEAVQRELQFNTSPDFWGGMMKKGAEYLRWDETGTVTAGKNAREIITTCERQPREVPKLNLLLEMEDHGRLTDTSAYRILTEEVRKRVEREQREMLEEQEEERRELQRQKAALQAIAAREQDDVRRGMENLERIERPSHGLMTSLTSMIGAPLQRRFSDVPHAGHGPDHMSRSEREREREREAEYDSDGVEYESDRERRADRRSRRRSGARRPWHYEIALVRKRR